jgi:hypothetical protein
MSCPLAILARLMDHNRPQNIESAKNADCILYQLAASAKNCHGLKGLLWAQMSLPSFPCLENVPVSRDTPHPPFAEFPE